jgi:hypothetical protein
MVTKLKSAAVAVLLGSSLLVAPGAAQAAPISGSALAGATASTDQAAPLIEVRHRGRRHWRHRHHHRHHHDNDAGAVAAGAIFGLALGAIAANAAASNNAVAYCSQRFRSYDPRSGTYLGYDGYRHPCP